MSFTAVGHEIVDSAGKQQADGQSLLDTVALLAALDSLFWDQNGCLSSRIHFVEVGRRGTEPANAASDAAQVYAARLTAQLRLLSAVLPAEPGPANNSMIGLTATSCWRPPARCRCSRLTTTTLLWRSTSGGRSRGFSRERE